jgi:hypothetical protein
MRYMLIILIVAMQSIAFPQPKKYIDVPIKDMPHGSAGFSVQNALRLWLLAYPSTVSDTTVAIYIGQSVWWKGGMFHPRSFVYDSDFKSGSSLWQWYDDGAGGKFWYDTTHFCGAVTFNTLSSNMQLYQFANTRMYPSTKYRVSFTAWSRKGSKIGVYIQKHIAPYTSYFGESVVTETSQYENWKQYSFIFTTPAGVAAADSQRLRFWFTEAIPHDTVYISRVRLQQWYDLPELQMSFDSIRGRGANRIANLRLTNKTTDSTQWTRGGWDTSGTVYSSPTLDSTNSWSTWLAYTYDLDPNCKLHKNEFEACSGPIFYRDLKISDVPVAFVYRMVKVLGDPTVNQGRDQRMIFRFKTFESTPASVMGWVNKQSTDVIDYWNWP